MAKDDATILKIAYAIFALCVAYITYNLAQMIGIQTGWSIRYEWYQKIQTVIAIAAAGLVIFTLKKDKERESYLLSSISELRKVTWPTWLEVKRMTIVVFIVVAFFAVMIGIFDLVWTKALNLIL